MTAKTPAATKPPINVELRKPFDFARIQGFLGELFSAWEKGRTLTEDGKTATCNATVYAEIVRSTFQLIAKISADAIEEAASPIMSHSFAEGVKSGGDAVRKGMSKLPNIKSQLDSEAIIQSIGAELRKAFEAGIASTKANTPDGPPRVASARQVVQRDQRTGDIIATVVNYQYDEAPGLQPPPL